MYGQTYYGYEGYAQFPGKVTYFISKTGKGVSDNFVGIGDGLWVITDTIRGVSAFIGKGPSEWTLNKTGVAISQMIGKGPSQSVSNKTGKAVVGP